MRESWDEMARSHQGFHDPPGSLPDRVHGLLRRRVIRWAQGLPRGARFLDVGCGRGSLAIGLARLRPDLEVLGMDLSQGMLDLAAAAAPEPRNPTWLRCEAGRWPLADQSVDAAVVMDLLANLDLSADITPLLQEARRVCRRWLLLEIKTPWVLGLLLRLRRRGSAAARATEFGLGRSYAGDGIAVHVHDPAALLPKGGAVPALAPWPLLPAPSRIYVLDLQAPGLLERLPAVWRIPA